MFDDSLFFLYVVYGVWFCVLCIDGFGYVWILFVDLMLDVVVGFGMGGFDVVDGFGMIVGDEILVVMCLFGVRVLG